MNVEVFFMWGEAVVATASIEDCVIPSEGQRIYVSRPERSQAYRVRRVIQQLHPDGQSMSVSSTTVFVYLVRLKLVPKRKRQPGMTVTSRRAGRASSRR